MMAEPVDDACREESLRGELKGEHGDDRHAERGELQPYEHRDTDLREAAVEIALEPIVGCAAPVVRENRRIACGRDIELPALQQDALNSEYHRAVEVSGLIRKRVVPAMKGNPLSVTVPEHNHSQKRKKCPSSGCRITPPSD